jgi:hypothetical protein
MATSDTIIKITDLVKLLDKKQQLALEFQLRKLILMSKAEVLSDSVKDNNITMAEIIREVRKVRNEC